MLQTVTPMLMTPAQAAEALGLSERKVRALVASRQINCRRVSRRIYFAQADLDEYVERIAIRFVDPLARSARGKARGPR